MIPTPLPAVDIFWLRAWCRHNATVVWFARRQRTRIMIKIGIGDLWTICNFFTFIYTHAACKLPERILRSHTVIAVHTHTVPYHATWHVASFRFFPIRNEPRNHPHDEGIFVSLYIINSQRKHFWKPYNDREHRRYFCRRHQILSINIYNH